MKAMESGLRLIFVAVAVAALSGCGESSKPSPEDVVIATGTIFAGNRCMTPCDDVRVELSFYPANHQAASFFRDQTISAGDEGRRFRATASTDEDFGWAVTLLTNGNEDRVRAMVVVGLAGAGNAGSEADVFSLHTVDLASEQIEWIDMILESLTFSPTDVTGEMLIETTVRIEVGRTA